ncbi:hypothetical protein [Streptomonospora arabica]|uniref:TRASH domain-containing protein n=1 Tax=Streptomonospora arabica TaxID=412417 RepID=A0ABV9SSJ0_9ACTN
MDNAEREAVTNEARRHHCGNLRVTPAKQPVWGKAIYRFTCEGCRAAWTADLSPDTE